MTFLKPMKESLRAHQRVCSDQEERCPQHCDWSTIAATLAVDASKAYHCVGRRKLRAAVEAKFPAALPLLA